MTEHSFTLVPFPDSNIPEIKIAGRISRKTNFLTVHYELTGNTEDILLPSAALHPIRKDELWKATCFEFFLVFPNEPQYWEINMSPSGDWNAYHMDAYRRVGFREEMAIQWLQFIYQREADCISVEAALDLNAMIREDNSIQAGVTSVIQTKYGHETYWALTHPNSQADFHLRESFIIPL